jgi:hypothetical protein
MNAVATLIAKLDQEEQAHIAAMDESISINDWDDGYRSGLHRALELVRSHKWPAPSTTYPVLSICLDDFVIAADDDAPQEAKDRLKVAESMTAEEWDYLTDLMADDIFNYDGWYDAMSFAIERIEKNRKGTDGPL